MLDIRFLDTRELYLKFCKKKMSFVLALLQ
jgi:hypothetical protein